MKFIWTFCIEGGGEVIPVWLFIELVELSGKLSRDLEVLRGNVGC